MGNRVNTRRRVVLALGAGALAAPLASFAQQQPAKVYRIGFLSPGSASLFATRLEGLREGLRDLGYVEGMNLVIDVLSADGNWARLPDLAAELVRLKVDVIVTHTTAGAHAVRQATATIPIVSAASGDLVVVGLVASLARPGGNITGSFILDAEITAKRLELLKTALPRARQVAVLVNMDNPASGLLLKPIEITAKSLKVELQQFKLRRPQEIEAAFSEMAKRRVEAVVVTEDQMLSSNNGLIANLAAKQRLLSAGGREFADAGGLIGYGADILAMFRRAATFVDKIFKGANPGEIPIEQASRFELIVNKKTAEALGLTIPQELLLRADRVIE